MRRVRAWPLAAVALLCSAMALGAGTGEPIELRVACVGFGGTPKDFGAVQDKINEITKQKIGATVKLILISGGAYSQQINLMLASGEKLDLMVTGVGWLYYSTQVAKGQLVALDELIAKDGQGIAQALGKGYLGVSRINGKIYGIPTVRDFASSYGFMMRKDILDKYRIDPKSIKTWDDAERVLKLVKDKEPGMIPCAPASENNSFATYMATCWDSLGDSLGVLSDNENATRVVDLYETPQYLAVIKKIKAWYDEGLLQKDATTNKTHYNALMRANKLFSTISTLKPGVERQVENECGMPVVAVRITPPIATTTSVASVMWSVPTNCSDPSKAVQFLNLMYSDPQIVNLLDWGIEGTHYVKQADGSIDYPAGVNASNTGYGLNLGWEFGNQFLSYIWKGDDLNLYKDMASFNASAIKSKALGFSFDSSAVKTEVAAVTNVVNQYALGLECGVLDPDKVLPIFVQKLKAAGIDKIVAEKQRQLTAWASASK